MLNKHILNFLKYFNSLFKKLNIPIGLKLWITLFCITFIGISINNNLTKLSELTIDGITLRLLMLGFFVSYFSLLINAFAWKGIIEWLGYKNLRINLIRLFLTSNLLKYFPGGIWHFVDRVRVLKKEIDTDKALISVLIEPFFMISGALFWVSFGEFNFLFRLMCFIPFFAFTGYWRTSLLIQLNRLKMSLIKKTLSHNIIEDFEVKPNILGSRYPFLPLLMEVIFIALRFLGFWFCLSAFSVADSFDTLHWSALFSLAWIVGLVVPSAPGGVGVFEACVLLITGSDPSEAGLISALLCYRLISGSADLFAAISAKIYK